MKDYYFTFGHGQKHFPGCVKITAACMNNARNRMIKEHGTQWAFEYDSYDDVHPKDRKIVASYIVIYRSYKTTPAQRWAQKRNWARYIILGLVSLVNNYIIRNKDILTETELDTLSCIMDEFKYIVKFWAGNNKYSKSKFLKGEEDGQAKTKAEAD